MTTALFSLLSAARMSFVNNAAIGTTSHFCSIEPETIHEIVATNLIAPMTLTRQVLPGMLEHDRGTVLNVSSLVGEIPMPHASCYGTSKAGLSMFTTLLRRDIVRSNVNLATFVLGIVPGTQLHAAGMKDGVVAHLGRKFSKLAVLQPDRVAQRMASLIERDRRGTFTLPPAAAPLVAWRRLPNAATDLLLRGSAALPP